MRHFIQSFIISCVLCLILSTSALAQQVMLKSFELRGSDSAETANLIEVLDREVEAPKDDDERKRLATAESIDTGKLALSSLSEAAIPETRRADTLGVASVVAGSGVGSSWLKNIASLIFVLSLVGVLGFFANRFMKGGIRNGIAKQSSAIIRQTLSLGAKRQILVLEIEDHRWLVGVTGSNIRLIDRISGPESLAQSAAQPTPDLAELQSLRIDAEDQRSKLHESLQPAPAAAASAEDSLEVASHEPNNVEIEDVPDVVKRIRSTVQSLRPLSSNITEREERAATGNQIPAAQKVNLSEEVFMS